MLAWIWLELGLAAQTLKASGNRPADAGFASRQTGSCDYFYRFELPRIDAWLSVVSRRDMTCAQVHADWF